MLTDSEPLNGEQIRSRLRRGSPSSSAGKESACNAADPGSTSGSGSSPGEGVGYPLQYSGLENSMDDTVAKSQIQLSNLHFLSCLYFSSQ